MAVYFLRYFLSFIEKTASAAAAFCLLLHNIEIYTYIERKKNISHNFSLHFSQNGKMSWNFKKIDNFRGTDDK